MNNKKILYILLLLLCISGLLLLQAVRGRIGNTPNHLPLAVSGQADTPLNTTANDNSLQVQQAAAPVTPTNLSEEQQRELLLKYLQHPPIPFLKTSGDVPATPQSQPSQDTTEVPVSSLISQQQLDELLQNLTPDLRLSRIQAYLIKACQLNDPQTLLLLLQQYGANPLQATHEGYTALHAAAQYCCLDCARYLLQAGADPMAQTKMQITPRILAQQNNCAEVDELLHEHWFPNSLQL